MITAVIQILTIPSAMGLYMSSTTLELEAANITIQLQDHNISTSHLTTTANTSQHQGNRVNSRKKNSNSHIINNRLIITSIAEVSFKRNRKKTRRENQRNKSSSIAKMRLCFPPHHSLLQRAFPAQETEREKKRKER
jgi:hypothetical protein